MTELPHPLPSVVVRTLNWVKYDVSRSVEEENRFYERLTSSVGLSYTVADNKKQEDALIAAKTVKIFRKYEICTEYQNNICNALGVKRSTFFKYTALLNEKDDSPLRPVDIIRAGNPGTFLLEVDVPFIEWIIDPNTTTIEKG